MTTNHTPEAIALAAGLLGQAKGDVSAARRAAGEAHGWLCSIDATYKPEPVAQAPDNGKAADVQRKLDVTLDALKQANADLQANESQRFDLTAKLAEAKAQLSAVQIQLKQALQAQAKPVPAPQAPTPAPSIQLAAEHLGLTGALAAPKPAPASVTPPPLPKATPAPAPVAAAPVAQSGADPYAHLPPAMRAWAAKRDNRTLEID